MDDALVFVLAAALGITGLITIVGAISKADERRTIRRMREKHDETIRMTKFYSAVCGKVPALTQEEYHDGIVTLIRKYHMGSRDGGLSLDDDTVGLAADRMVDTILQDRLTRQMLDTAELQIALNKNAAFGAANTVNGGKR